jgi:hypothetical protein
MWAELFPVLTHFVPVRPYLERRERELVDKTKLYDVRAQYELVSLLKKLTVPVPVDLDNLSREVF